MGDGSNVRKCRTYLRREEYEGTDNPSQPLEVHWRFIKESLRFGKGLSVRCTFLERVYEEWLRDSSHGESTNNVDKNFLYEEIEVMSGGVADWVKEPYHHFTGVDFLKASVST